MNNNTDTLILTDEQAAEAQDDLRLPVFVYGTLRPGCGNDRTWHGLATARHDGKCRVDDHRLVSNGAFPYMLPAEGFQSFGCLIVPLPEFYDEALRYMDSLEGVPMHYTRETVAVNTPDGIVMAFTYIPARPDQYANYKSVVGNDWVRDQRDRHTAVEDRWSR